MNSPVKIIKREETELNNVASETTEDTPDGSNGQSPEESYIEIFPDADAFLSQNEPEKNFGNIRYLKIKTYSTSLDKVAILRFDLTSLGGVQLEKAVLKLCSKRNTENRRFNMQHCQNDSWEEGKITWQDSLEEDASHIYSFSSQGVKKMLADPPTDRSC